MTLIRAATLDDISAITSIYAHHVLEGIATFEEVPPTEAQMAERMTRIQRHSLPYLIAEDARGDILGYAYAGPYNPRAAYRYCAEDTIYLRRDAAGKGLGSNLLAELITACEARGIRQLLAVISGPPGASHKLHERLGFEQIGHAKAIGYKFSAWHDVRYLQRALGPGDSTPPSAKGGIISL